MSQHKKLMPKRRFRDFKELEGWKQLTIGEYGYFYYGKSAPKWSVVENAKTPCVRYGELYTKFTEKIDTVYSYTNISAENLKFSTGNEVLVPRVGEKPLDFANCSWLSIPNVAIGEMISVYTTKQHPLFTAYMFNALFKHEFAKRVEGGNVSNLYYTYLEDISVSYPSMEEQDKVVNFLEKLNNLIQAQQKKLHKTKTLKSAYLAEMFPSDGELKPKQRFIDFKDNWKVCLIKELGSVYTGSTPSTIDKNNWIIGQKGHVWITPTDIKSLLISDSERHLTDTGWKKARVLPENSILITCIASIGKNAINTVPAAFNQQINAIIPYKNNSYFVLSIMEREKKKFSQLAGHTSMAIINKTEFENFTLTVPHEKEQTKIGNFFKLLDQKIALEQRKLDKLNNIKHAYLNEMFV